jgi:putative membrane protein
MMYWGNGMGGWGMAMMTITNLLFWGLIIAGIVVLVRYFGRTADPAQPPTERPVPQQVLADRFARGEIDEEEYRLRLHVLADARTPARDGG